MHVWVANQKCPNLQAAGVFTLHVITKTVMTVHNRYKPTPHQNEEKKMLRNISWVKTPAMMLNYQLRPCLRRLYWALTSMTKSLR